MLSTLRKAKELYERGGTAMLLDETCYKFGKLRDDQMTPRLATIDWIDDRWYNMSSEALAERMSREETIDDVLQTAYEFTGRGPYRRIAPLQHPQELKKLGQRIAERTPETVGEIGTYNGGTLYLWTQLFESAQTFISLDVDYGHRRRRQFYQQFTDAELHLLERDSQTRATARQIDQLRHDGIDFLFVDGDHRYEGVKRDFELYRSRMSSDGVMAFHDIKTDSTGVPEFWDEIQDVYETEEIVSRSEFDRGPHIHERGKQRLRAEAGIGLVYLNNRPQATSPPV